MPSAGLLALLDDIASLLDDVATMTKLATKKTAGVVGDDLALNAHQVAGISPSRELPVVAAVARGSLVNKIILIPIALGITALTPFLVKSLLVVGGAFLCFEGGEKIVHKVLKSKLESGESEHQSASRPEELEASRIKTAVRTDFILSAEILVIALGTASRATLLVQALTLCAIGFGMTVVVYGSVALIVKGDDLGLYLQSRRGRSSVALMLNALGTMLVQGAPKVMRLLSLAGTVAMFLVGGEIIAHGIAPLEGAIHAGVRTVAELAPGGAGIVVRALYLVAVTALGVGLGCGAAIVAEGLRLVRRRID